MLLLFSFLFFHFLNDVVLILNCVYYRLKLSKFHDDRFFLLDSIWEKNVGKYKKRETVRRRIVLCLCLRYFESGLPSWWWCIHFRIPFCVKLNHSFFAFSCCTDIEDASVLHFGTFEANNVLAACETRLGSSGTVNEREKECTRNNGNLYALFVRTVHSPHLRFNGHFLLAADAFTLFFANGWCSRSF